MWWSLLERRNFISIQKLRCEVFKNMLAPNTLESESSTIEVKEVPTEAVGNMLKYIYTLKGKHFKKALNIRSVF